MDELNALNAPKKVVDGLVEVFDGLAQMFAGVSEQLDMPRSRRRRSRSGNGWLTRIRIRQSTVSGVTALLLSAPDGNMHIPKGKTRKKQRRTYHER